MAKHKAQKRESRSDFLRKNLGKDPNLGHDQINQRWSKSGHLGEISRPLYYKVRAELGIQTQWVWAKAPAGDPGSTGAATSGDVYQFKITLVHTDPPIWRRIQVQNCTLDKLHEHIQTAMGWTNSHLHQFKINNILHGDPLLMRESFEELRFVDSTRTRLSEVLPKSGERFKFKYEYDFGDSWQHEVLFEGRPPAIAGQRYPVCLEGAGNCPPEDVGGVSGYLEFLDALADPTHEEHDTMREWIGGKFDPETFDPVDATKQMKKGLPDWR